MTFAYVCTNYNNTHFTADAIASLIGRSDIEPHIVVVDNASRAEQVAELDAIVARYPQVEIIRNAENVGYFPGLNVGIAHVRATRPDIAIMVVGNNDLTFPSDFGTQMARVLPRLQHCPVISPNMITLDGLHQNPHVISGLSRVRELIYDLYFASPLLARLIRIAAAKTKGLTDRADEGQHATGQYIYQGHGSCYILTSRFFELFDELWAPTFLFGEEFFLSRQLAEKGMQVYYEPGIVIQHHCNGAIQNMPSKQMWELGRNAHRVYRRYVKPWHKQGKPLAGKTR
jgi:GT2 family glycosyltransferase